MLDILGASAGLVLLAPLFVLLAIAIKVETPGPILFSQIRLGRDGRHFRLYKFRKFRHDSDTTGCAVTVRNDSRMTRVGRFVERTKLDELPQLWNVLIGDMSLVGPRPETLDFADCFTGPFLRILDHTPGIFGPCQVIFRNESALYPEGQDPHEFYRIVLFQQKASIDLECFAKRSVLSDLGWIVRGSLAVFGIVPPLSLSCLIDGVPASSPRTGPLSRGRDRLVNAGNGPQDRLEGAKLRCLRILRRPEQP